LPALRRPYFARQHNATQLEINAGWRWFRSGQRNPPVLTKEHTFTVIVCSKLLTFGVLTSDTVCQRNHGAKRRPGAEHRASHPSRFTQARPAARGCQRCSRSRRSQRGSARNVPPDGGADRRRRAAGQGERRPTRKPAPKVMNGVGCGPFPSSQPDPAASKSAPLF
jgi:hypothetical protein